MAEPLHTYLVALGSNMRRASVGAPARIIEASLEMLADTGFAVIARSRIVSSRPVGPSLRSYANAAALVETELAPAQCLASLQAAERQFGRVRRGSRWRGRPLDLDIVLWSGGMWHSRDLVIPHPLFRLRDFVLLPAAEIAPTWRDPVTGMTLRQLSRRQRSPRPSSR